MALIISEYNSKDSKPSTSKLLNTFSFLGIQGVLVLLGLTLLHYFNIPAEKIQFSMNPSLFLQTLLFLVPMVLLAFLLTSLPALKIDFIRDIFNRIIDSPFGIFIEKASLWAFVFVSAFAGIGEEILFRGILQNYIGIIAAALIFGAFHFVSFAFFLLASVVGAYLGGVFIWTGHNMIPPILIHSIYDFIVLILMQKLARNHFIERELG